jgi:ribosomal protein S18 acetylase RimI-like enzyme
MIVMGGLEFGHADRKRIYEYVERHGAVEPAELRDRLDVDPRGFRHHVAILKRDGRLEVDDGRLTVAVEASAEEEFVSDDLEFHIRPARQEDLSGVVGAIRQVAGEKTYIEAESVADEIDHEEALLRHNELESRMFFVATVEDEVVGWVHIHAPELEKLRHTAELTVGVLEEYRGRNVDSHLLSRDLSDVPPCLFGVRSHGVGSHLLSRGLEWASSNGYEKVYQSVPATNEGAIEFLEDHGWETEAVREDHYKLDDRYVDEVMMAVEL